MLTLDGSLGEGGGQVLRSSLALSALTGTPFVIENIRANRSRPGLARQHLTCVRAAAAISGARVEGDALRSRRVTFTPGPVRPGSYQFAVGTAGSAVLVLQTVLPPLMVADGPSELILEGGTHNDKAPPFPFLAEVFAPVLHDMGVGLDLTLERRGFHPRGGGRIRAEIHPAHTLQVVERVERGPVEALTVEIMTGGLPRSAGRRAAKAIARGLQLASDQVARTELGMRDPTFVVLVRARAAGSTELFSGFGGKGTVVERVIDQVVDETRAWLDAGVPIGEHLADQLLLPMSMAGGGLFRTVTPSLHTRTHAQVIPHFLDVEVTLLPVSSGAWQVHVTPSHRP